MANIILNRIKTPDGTVLTSNSVHDYVSHDDKNGYYYAVDGGQEYLKRCTSEGAPDYEELSLYDIDDFTVIREAFKWGTYGKKGDQPLTFRKLCELEDDHIQAILDTQTHISARVRSIFKKEQEHRKKHSLSVSAPIK